MASPTDRQIADWLVNLATIAPVPGRDPALLSAAIREMTPHLRSRYNSAEFDSATREHVARRCKFFPSYAELCDALDSLPSRAPVAPPLPDAVTGLDDMDRSWLNFWHRRRDEIGASAGPFKWGNRVEELASLASLVSKMSPKAWRIISPDSVTVYVPPTDAEVVAVAKALRMPGAPLAGRPMPGEDKEPVKPSYATGEALRRMREARPGWRGPVGADAG